MASAKSAFFTTIQRLLEATALPRWRPRLIRPAGLPLPASGAKEICRTLSQPRTVRRLCPPLAACGERVRGKSARPMRTKRKSPAISRGASFRSKDPKLLDDHRSLFNDRSDDAGADSAAAFADCEAQLFFHRDRNDQLDGNRDVVARHDHFRAFRKRDDARHVRRA